MANLRLAPFIQLPKEVSPEYLHAYSWQEKSGAKNWDYQVDLSYSRTVEINKKAIWEHCALAEDAVISVFAEWSTSLTNYARARSPEHILTYDSEAGENRAEIELNLPIRGSEVGGELYLDTIIVVYEPGSTTLPGATQAGSILWSQREEFTLEAPGARLPICVENFQNFPEKFDDPNASWHVELAVDGLEHSASVGMVIYLNSRKQTLVNLLTPDEPSVASALLIEMLRFDVQRQLLMMALRDEAFIDPAYEYLEGSLGNSLRMVVRNVFHNASLPEVKSLFERAPERFESQLQGTNLRIEEVLNEGGTES